MALTDDEKELNALRFHLGDASPMGRTNTWVEAWDRIRGRFGAGSPGGNYRDLRFGGGMSADLGEKRRNDALFIARYGVSPQDALEGYRVGDIMGDMRDAAGSDTDPYSSIKATAPSLPPTTSAPALTESLTPGPVRAEKPQGFMGYLDGLRGIFSRPAVHPELAAYKNGLRDIQPPEPLPADVDVGQRYDQLGRRITQSTQEPINVTPGQRRKAEMVNRIASAPLELTEAKADALKNDKGPLNGKITLTPEAIKREGIRYYQTGKLPTLGMGGGADKTAIINFAQKYAQETGDEPKAMTLRWAQFGANEGAYKRNTQYATQVGQFEVKAKKEFALAKDLAAKVDAKGNNAFARWKREVLDGKMAGDPDFKNLQASMMTALTEYGKIVGGGALSAQALTDSARKEMEEILKASESAAAIRSRIDNVIMPSMRYQMEAIRETQGGLEAKLDGADNNDPLGVR